MSKSISRILFVVFLILTLWLLWDLLQPEKSATTSAIDKEIIITENIAETFTTDFDYGYELSLVLLEDKFLTAEKEFNVLFKREGQILSQKTELLNIDRNNNLVYERFIAESGDDFELKINGIDKSLIEKKARIYADVTGGGPSVGIAYAKALKPYFWIVFGILALITMTIGIYNWRKKASS